MRDAPALPLAAECGLGFAGELVGFVAFGCGAACHVGLAAAFAACEGSEGLDQFAGHEAVEELIEEPEIDTLIDMNTER